jgi:4-carboxymuconolactone decarboxylase
MGGSRAIIGIGVVGYAVIIRTWRRHMTERDSRSSANRPSLEVLREEAPEVADAFVAMREAIEARGPLEAKVRSLIVCGAFAATSNEAGFRSHYRRALAAGATREEVLQAILLALGFTQGVANVAKAITWMDA